LKNITHLILLIIIFTNTLSAQIDKGLIGGLNYSMISDNSDNLEKSGKIGFFIGGFKSFNISKNVTFKPEIILSLQRFRLLGNFNSDKEDPAIPIQGLDIDVNFSELLIQIPLMLDYNIKEKFSIGLGPQIGYMILERASNNNDNSFDFKSTDDYRIGFSYAFELGYQFNDMIGFSCRYLKRFTIRNGLKSKVFQIGLLHSF
jgi:hypothetical protein